MMNLSKCDRSRRVKISAYLTIVRFLLEYAACVWDDPYKKYLVHNIEEVQRRATRWVLSDYSHYSNVTEMLRSLGWPTLESRYVNRLTHLHKIIYHQTPAIQMPTSVSLHTFSQNHKGME